MTTPSSPRPESAKQQWHQALTPGPGCLPLERLDADLTAAERTHVAGCARCQSELELFQAFEANTPVEGEGLAVAWIAAQTKRRLDAARGAGTPAATPAPSKLAMTTSRTKPITRDANVIPDTIMPDLINFLLKTRPLELSE